MLELLQKRKLREASRKALDKPITVEDVSKAIRSLGKGKSPGPDLLTAEFYQTFEDILAEPLTEVLTESHTLYRLPTSTQQGVVKILYSPPRSSLIQFQAARGARNYVPQKIETRGKKTPHLHLFSGTVLTRQKKLSVEFDQYMGDFLQAV